MPSNGSIASIRGRFASAQRSTYAEVKGAPGRWNFKIDMTLPEHSSLIAEEQAHGLESY